MSAAEAVTPVRGSGGRWPSGARTDEQMTPFAAHRDRLTTIPGVGQRAAQTIIAEIGVDMARCPTPAHLVS